MGNPEEHTGIDRKTDTATQADQGKKVKGKKKGKEKSSESAADIMKDLAFEAKAMQASAQVIADRFVKNISGRITAVVEKLESADSGKLVSAKRARKMLKKIKSVKLQPDRGRRRDLKRIEKTAERIETIVRVP